MGLHNLIPGGITLGTEIIYYNNIIPGGIFFSHRWTPTYCFASFSLKSEVFSDFEICRKEGFVTIEEKFFC